VKLPTRIVHSILELAKRAPKDGHGRKTISVRAKIAENRIIRQAKRRQAELVAKGTPKAKAEEQAIQEASADLRKQERNLAPSTIKRRMQQRRF
jgi:hypothetical protein